MFFTWLLLVVTLALGVVTNAHLKRITCATGQTTSNRECCALYPIVKTMQANLFDGGKCNEEARSALRLAFHDAIGYSIHGGKGGGADGSILMFNATETAYNANGGIDDITALQYPVYQTTSLTPGDFVHLAAAVGTANCPGAPRLQFMYGRPAPKAPAPDLTVPEPTDSVTKILARFADAGFTPPEVIALMASHTIAAADVTDPTIPGTPFDSTVETFDTQVFLEVLLRGASFPGNGSHSGEVLSPMKGEMRLESDFRLSQDSRTACLWQMMIDNQTRMQTQFKDAMAKLQVLGQNIHNMIDCSEVVPVPAALSTPTKFPASFSQKDIKQACPQLRFPKLQTVAGQLPVIASTYGKNGI